MKLKLWGVLLLLPVIISSGCSNDAATGEVKVGMIKYLNSSEENMNELIKKIEEKNSENFSNYSTVYYDNLNSMQMGLSSGHIDEMSTYRCVSNYVSNKGFDYFQVPVPFKLSDSFCCAFRDEDAALKDAFNKALNGMLKDGTLINLTSQYITNLNADEEPQAIDMEHIDGADTIKVAVTGDLPPLDLIKSDGTPAGFNTAVLAEISKRINKNFELVQIESGARAAALTSGLVDVLFWVRLPDNDSDMPADVDRPEGIVFSTPYFSDKIVHLKWESNK